jgi:hypothetical protein
MTVRSLRGNRGGSGLRMSTIQSFFISACRFLVLCAFASCTTILFSQTIKVKLVNGRNGLPMSHTCVDLGIGHIDHMLSIPTDGDGVAKFSVTDDDAEINMAKRWNECGSWGVIDPIVKHDGIFGLHIGYVLCQSGKSDYSWLARMTFSTNEVLRQGIVMQNSCSKITALPKTGEVIIFVRPLNLWEKLRQ